MTIIRCLDFETTGFPPNAGVCEVGWTDVQFREGEPATIYPTVSLLCNPGMPIGAGARDVHGINDEMVAGEPPTSERFRRLMEGVDVFCAHNAEFERAFFGGGDKPWICTYKVALNRHPGLPNHRNGMIPEHLSISLDPSRCVPLHRAGPDTYVTARILQRFLMDGLTIEDMVAISARPKQVVKMPFGKHAGTEITRLSTGYLQWAADKLSKADVRHACAAELRRRLG